MEGKDNSDRQEEEVKVLGLALLEFLCGSLMFSFWLGILLGKDIRNVRDGNPGSTNLWRATNYRWGLLALLLDYLKGFVPLVFIIQGGVVSGFSAVPVAIAPVIGHAFSPFLRGKGGKAIDVTFGVWSALTTWEGPVVLGVSFTVFSLFRRNTSPEDDSARAILGMLVLLAYLLIRRFSLPLIVIWLVNFAVIAFKHKVELINLARKMCSQEAN